MYGIEYCRMKSKVITKHAVLDRGSQHGMLK